MEWIRCKFLEHKSEMSDKKNDQYNDCVNDHYKVSETKNNENKNNEKINNKDETEYLELKNILIICMIGFLVVILLDLIVRN